jgi:glycosyltransferase involved in cell wall biosynthesis
MASILPQSLVSVIVRSMGRPSLTKALDSIATQTHRPMEIVLVDAAGSGAAIAAHGGLPVRFVRKGPLDRSRAANAGLEAARGGWVMFLDEDDEIDCTHVEDLLLTAANARVPAAYSQTRLVAASGESESVFGGPFDQLALFRSNYLSLHAVLFNRALVTQGCRFDESLAMFEDWDFWLQVAMRTPFAFTGRPTAIYRAETGESGAEGGVALDREAVLAQRERLMRKWRPAQAALEALD